VSADEELRRVLPVIESLRAKTDAIISIDTSKPEVIRAASNAGAGLINDVRALSDDGALEAAAATQCAVCVMHMQGDPRSMQLAPHYVDVVREVREFLHQRVQRCRMAGISADRIVIDPGFGFGKTLEHNLQLLRHLGELGSGASVADELGSEPPAAGWPIMVGLSRKSIVGRLTGRSADQRVHGSVALAVMAVINGARIVRVHDVGATVDALKTVEAVQTGCLSD
jgi:dihydropteroate synthase